MNRLIAKAVDGLLLCAFILPLSLWTYQRNGLWTNEMAFWKDCIKKAPRKERVHHNLGFVYYELGHLDDAGREFEEALRFNPDYALSLYNLGLVYYRRGLLSEAVNHYTRTIELHPTFPNAYYNLGLAYHHLGQYQEAINAYEALRRLKPNYENAHHRLGLAYKQLRQWERAIQSFQEELNQHPNNFSAHLCLAETYMELKEGSKALFHFQKAITDPDLREDEKIRKMALKLEDAQREKGKIGKQTLRRAGMPSEFGDKK
jgi:tetratricopeptide (TPR) repeat protein